MPGDGGDWVHKGVDKLRQAGIITSEWLGKPVKPEQKPRQSAAQVNHSDGVSKSKASGASHSSQRSSHENDSHGSRPSSKAARVNDTHESAGGRDAGNRPSNNGQARQSGHAADSNPGHRNGDGHKPGTSSDTYQRQSNPHTEGAHKPGDPRTAGSNNHGRPGDSVANSRTAGNGTNGGSGDGHSAGPSNLRDQITSRLADTERRIVNVFDHYANQSGRTQHSESPVQTIRNHRSGGHDNHQTARDNAGHDHAQNRQRSSSQPVEQTAPGKSQQTTSEQTNRTGSSHEESSRGVERTKLGLPKSWAGMGASTFLGGLGLVSGAVQTYEGLKEAWHGHYGQSSQDVTGGLGNMSSGYGTLLSTFGRTSQTLAKAGTAFKVGGALEITAGTIQTVRGLTQHNDSSSLNLFEGGTRTAAGIAMFIPQARLAGMTWSVSYNTTRLISSNLRVGGVSLDDVATRTFAIGNREIDRTYASTEDRLRSWATKQQDLGQYSAEELKRQGKTNQDVAEACLGTLQLVEDARKNGDTAEQSRLQEQLQQLRQLRGQLN